MTHYTPREAAGIATAAVTVTVTGLGQFYGYFMAQDISIGLTAFAVLLVGLAASMALIEVWRIQ